MLYQNLLKLTSFYILGINHQTIYDGLYVFDTKTGKWLGEVAEEQVSYHALHTSVAFVGSMIAISVVALLLILVGCYILIRRRFAFQIRKFVNRVKDLIWCPRYDDLKYGSLPSTYRIYRAGEPLWAEITRTLFRLLFLGVFIGVVVTIILQVYNSPIIEQMYHTHTDDYTIDVPGKKS